MSQILILLNNHLCRAPRAQKEADALAGAGYEVKVSGILYDDKLARYDSFVSLDKKWTYEPYLDLRSVGLKKWFQNIFIRLFAKLAREIFIRFGIFSPELLGYGIRKMLKFAFSERADLTIVHSEAGLWVGAQLLKKGYRVGVDFEDWFSEDLIEEHRMARPIDSLKKLEGRLLRDCTYCLTTSHCLAESMAASFDTKKPTVVYNAFPWKDRERVVIERRDRKDPGLMSINWVSQVIGPGRGLDVLFGALLFLKNPIEIHLRGDLPARYRSWLQELIPEDWRKRVYIHATIPNHQLLSAISEHDIGLALESPYCLNKELTISNKIFHYLVAGIAVIATQTKGQNEVFKLYPKIGQLIPPNDPPALAQAINYYLKNPNELHIAKLEALRAAKEWFCWENQSPFIIGAVKSSLSHNESNCDFSRKN